MVVRACRAAVVVALMGTVVGCTTFFDTDLPEADAAAGDGGGDAGDGGDAADVGDTDADGTDTDAALDADVAPDAPTENLCGGAEPLTFGGEVVEAGDPCGDCGDGVLVCVSARDVECVRASSANACGGCGPLVAAPGAECGACGGELACGDDAVLSCDATTNACGGCGTVDAPGAPCVLAGGVEAGGVTLCASPEATTCVGPGRNACGGVEPLDATVGSPCGTCGLGRWVCDGSDALLCDGEDSGVNACGGCTALAGAPGGRCGECRGEWACAGELLVVCDEPLRNECGGCADIGAGVPGESCEGDRFWACDGLDELVCPDEPRNACGGERFLAEEPGEACGPCGDGFRVCSSPNSVTCVGATELNGCGTCGALPAPLGAACGAAAVWQCDGDGNPVCALDPAVNACGGAAALDVAPGAPCGLCGSGLAACDGPEATTCVGADSGALRTFYPDVDHDGFGDAAGDGVEGCEPPEGYVDDATDCDDGERFTYPGAPELCDGANNDCDDEIDEEVAYLPWYPDGDHDGFGDATATPVVDCSPPPDTVLDATDCDDARGDIYPAAAEACDGDDNDCDEQIDEDVTNACGGCSALDPAVGTLCGACLLDQYVCSGTDATVCDGDTPCPALEVTTGDANDVTATSATLNGRVVTVPALATAVGFCWSATGLPTREASDCVTTSTTVTATTFSSGVATLLPGRRYDVRAWIVAGGNTLYGNVARFETTRPVPTELVATDAVFGDHVGLTWIGVEGATGYELFRDGEWVTTEVAAAFDDFGASGADTLEAPGDLNATAGTSSDAVIVTWSPPAPSAAPPHSYAVRAAYPAGPSEFSTPATGSRAPASVTAYEVAIDGGDWQSAGDSAELRVDDAPQGSVVAAVADASDGTGSAVALSLTGIVTAPGARVSVVVRALADDVAGAASAPASGYRGVGEPAATWERSAGDEDGAYATLAGATGLVAVDSSPPPDGEGRWYRAIVSAPGAAPLITEPDRGFATALPAVELAAPSATSESSATATLTVLRAGGPPATAHGVCWSDLPGPAPDDGVSPCVDLGPIVTLGPVEVELDGLAPGTTYFARAFATSERGTAYSDEVVFVSVPAAPTELVADDGASDGEVVVSWRAAVGALEYRVVRRVVGSDVWDELGVTDGTMWIDADAPAPPVPDVSGVRLTASAGTDVDAVVLRWAPALAAPGETAEYAVIATNSAGESAPSGTDTGFRAAAAVTSYELSVGGSLWLDMGGDGSAVEYRDVTAPRGALVGGTAVAGDGTSSSFVALEIAGDAVNVGASVTYAIRAVNAAGASAASEEATGYRGVGERGYVWEVATAEDGSYAELAGGTTRAYQDATAPESGEPRWYRCRISADGAADVVTASDAGFRNAGLPGIETGNVVSITDTEGRLVGTATSLGAPAPTAHGFCWGATANPTVEAAECVDLGALAATGEFSHVLDGLAPGERLNVRAFATNSSGTAYGGNVVFTTVPAAPATFVASDGTSTTAVSLSWSAAQGATTYAVFRDGAELASVAGTTFEDTTAGEPGVPGSSGLTVSASDATYSDRVAVTWSAPSPAYGASHTYAVVARNAAGDSAPSASDSGFRAALPITAYELKIDSGAWTSVGNVLSYSDYAAPAGTVNGGTAAASDGTGATVTLTLSGASGSDGTTRNYRVRAVNSAGVGTPSASADPGRRRVGDLQYQWERAAADTGPWASLSGQTAAAGTDATAPSTGDLRWYRCRVSADGAVATVYSTTDTGFRSALPALRTTGVASVTTTSAAVSGAFDSLGGPPATVMGACVGVGTPTLDSGAICTTAATEPTEAPFTVTVAGLSPGTAYSAVVFATNTAGTAYGAPVTFTTVPAAPTNVVATDGTSATGVTVTWSAAAGATRYEVWRDGALLSSDAATPFTDTTATAGGVPTATGFGLTASDGTSATAVTLAWSAPSVPTGPSHTYRVRAANTSGTSGDSTSDTGFRAGSPITRYELQIGAAGWTAIGLATTYSDTTAPAGSIVPGSAVASDGTSPSFVSLSLSGTSTSPGASVTYKLRAVNAAGVGAASGNVTGRRGTGTLVYDWQRSSADEPSGWTSIPGATTQTYDDTAAPAGGQVRYYRCALTATGATAAVSGWDSGYRNAAVPGVATSAATSVSATGATLNGSLTSLGSPAATERGFCYATHAAPGLADTCVSAGAPSGTGPFSAPVAALAPGTTYFVAAYATNAAGTAFGGSVTVLTLPSAPTGVSATDGANKQYVDVAWTATPGAESYRVLRDGATIATAVTGTTYRDTGAAAGGVPVLGAVTATQGTLTDRVEVTWAAATAPPGTTHTYTVVAVNSTGAGAASTPDTGYRSAASVDGYTLTVDGADLDKGTSLSHTDTGAAAGSLSVGAASATDGTLTTGVSLSVSTPTSTPGATRTYSLVATSTAGASAPSVATGWRGVGAIALAWQRSAGDASSSFTALTGASSSAYLDATAPTNGRGRYYRVAVSADGAASVVSGADRGWRLPESCVVGAPDVPDQLDADCDGDGYDGDIDAAVFVSAGAIAASNGSISRPFLAIQTGIAATASLGRTQVWVTGGTYAEELTLADGVSLYGGFSSDFTTHAPADYVTTVASPTPRALIVAGYTGTGAVEGFLLSAGDAGADSRASSVGLLAVNVTGDLQVAFNVIEAGDGANGAGGAVGAGGSPGGRGGNGGAATAAAGGSAGAAGSSTCSVSGAAGGAGGSQGANGVGGGTGNSTTDGGRGGTGGAGGLAATAAILFCVSPPEPGVGGSGGTAGHAGAPGAVVPGQAFGVISGSGAGLDWRGRGGADGAVG
ncbi:MAG: hypothetical protein H6697_10205, partial [Myxococcales bacterium]|nr:hypothetical protein [Myxococcales bacterium]